MRHLAAAGAEHPLAPDRREEVRALAQAVAQRLGPGVGLQHLGRAESADRHEGGADRHPQLDLDLGALDLVRDVSDGVEGAPQMTDRLLVGAAAQRLGGGALVMRNGARQLVAALEMLGDLGRDRVRAGSPRRLRAGRPTRA